ncbi:hypothetical protein NKH85_19690 [Mesorhizobium sp. M0924]|uniref:hypothetical protein n=1 Tax=unclassified Mesorhizobium TaxID=325217 RepID=UPI0033399ACE
MTAFANDLRQEIEALKSGLVASWNGKPRAQALRSSRRKLARVYEIAGHFGYNVGQPEPPSKRVSGLNPALQKLISTSISRYSRVEEQGDDDGEDDAAIEDEKVVDSALAREGRKLFRRASRLQLQVEALRRAGHLLFEGKLD